MDQEQKQKLKELDEKYQRRLFDLKQRSLKLTVDFLKKADQFKASQILKQLKEQRGRDT